MDNVWLHVVIQRKHALERRKLERDMSDRFLRQPAAKPPEPRKQILRKGAGVQRYGVNGSSPSAKKQLSPRSNVKQMQQRLREHVRQQRQQLKQQEKSGQHHIQQHAVLDDPGVGWQTARKLAAQGLDNLLHDVIPEDSPPKAPTVLQVPAGRGMDDLLRELGPSKTEPSAASNYPWGDRGLGTQVPGPQHQVPQERCVPGTAHHQPAQDPVPPEHTHTAPMNEAENGSALEEGSSAGNSSARADCSLRRGVTSISRHRPRPQNPSISESEHSPCPDPCTSQPVCETEALPAWARLAGSLTNTGQETTSSFASQPRWAELVSSREHTSDDGGGTFAFQPLLPSTDTPTCSTACPTVQHPQASPHDHFSHAVSTAL